MIFRVLDCFTLPVTELGGPPHAQTRGLRGHFEINIIRAERDMGGAVEQPCLQSQLLTELKHVTIYQYSVLSVNYLTQKSLYSEEKGRKILLSTLL